MPLNPFKDTKLVAIHSYLPIHDNMSLYSHACGQKSLIAWSYRLHLSYSFFLMALSETPESAVSIRF